MQTNGGVVDLNQIHVEADERRRGRPPLRRWAAAGVPEGGRSAPSGKEQLWEGRERRR
jgi:hypothetical protein